MIELTGEGDLSVKVIADSMAFGTRITTLELTFPVELDFTVMQCRKLSRLSWGVSHGMRTLVVTGTEFKHLVEGYIHPLVSLVQKALDTSEPKEFEEHDWHVPYYHEGFWQETGDGTDLLGNTSEEAKHISVAALCSMGEGAGEDPKGLFEAMVEGGGYRLLEHQAKPMGLRAINMTDDLDIVFDEGVTHFDRKGRTWSGNFHDWVQLSNMKSVIGDDDNDG